LGSALATPSVTTVTASPYLRLRAQWAFQTEYGDGADVEYDQGLNSIEISTTAGYLGGTTPANWVVDVPDFTGASYDPSWGLHAGATASWAVTGAHGNVLAFFGATLVDGAQVVGAVAASDAASFDRLGFTRRRPRAPSQLDRRLKPQR
jgi:hypothetical protein